MSSYYHYNTHQHPTSANAQTTSSHHSSRGRRAPRLSQNHKQYRSVRKEEEAVAVTNFRQRFEAGRSFDLEDDAEFCPTLLTDSDMNSYHSSSSDRSSLSSGSPEHSPQSHQVAPDTFSLNSNSNPYIPFQSQPTTLKLHQPAATRAIPIVNPSTGIRMSSPPQSVSPQRLQNSMRPRW